MTKSTMITVLQDLVQDAPQECVFLYAIGCNSKSPMSSKLLTTQRIRTLLDCLNQWRHLAHLQVIFAKPIDQQLVVEVDFCALNPKSAKDIESVFLVCKEKVVRD